MAFLSRRYGPPTLVTGEGDPFVMRTEARQPVADTWVARRLSTQHQTKESPFFTPETAPPEVQEAMAGYIQDYEQEWFDLPVPALSGLTPRQAADDPTRRDDLVRLLARSATPTARPT